MEHIWLVEMLVHHCLLNWLFGFSHWSILSLLKVEVLLGLTTVLVEWLIVLGFYRLIHVVLFVIILSVLTGSRLNARVTRIFRLVVLI